MAGDTTNKIFTRKSLNKIRGSIKALVNEQNGISFKSILLRERILTGFAPYDYDPKFDIPIDSNEEDIIYYVGYYILENFQLIEVADFWINSRVQNVFKEFYKNHKHPKISVTEIISKYVHPTNRDQCIHICSNGYIYVNRHKSAIGNRRGKDQCDRCFTIKSFIQKFLIKDLDSNIIDQIEYALAFHISFAQMLYETDSSNADAEDCDKYCSFIPICYYCSNQQHVLFTLTLLQSDYIQDGFISTPIIGHKILPLQDYLRSSLWPLLMDQLRYDQYKMITESIKSAKAAIMSRNMSHNLGSHVMFYIKQKLQSVSKIINNDVLHNIITGSQLNIEELQKKLQNSANIELPFLVGLGRFINYLQERQDYIATVATNYIPARSTISFKDFIYDELKPDLRYERHKKNNSSSDNGWQPKNLLLDYIAYSEGYSKSDAIEIKFGEFDGHNPQDVTAETDFQALRKFNVAVPGGVIGRQAIFSIVENIIRNAAKHSEHRTDGKLVLQLSLVDAEKDFTGDFLTDKFRCMRKEKGSMESGESLVKLYQNHKDAFHILRIKLDMPNKKEDIEALVGKLGEDYVEEDGSMKETSKGLKEMRISAAWLRGHSIDTAIPTTEPPVLAVYSEPYKDDKDKETISYFLCIPKPCKVAFVVDKELLTYIDDNGKESSYLDLNPMLEPFGCAVFGYDDETKQLNKKEQNDKEQGKKNKYQISDIADYEIVCMLLDDKQKSEKVNSILPYISSRHITNEETTKAILETLKNASDKKSAIDTIYEYWFKDKYPMSSSKLMVADAKANTDSKKAKSPLSEDSSVVLSTTGSIVSTAQSGCANSVVYSTHFKGLNHSDNVCDGDNLEELESKEKKNAEYNQWLSNAACIESITGNNSTDRLIRQDEWTKEWKYKHLSAGLARVAIFDERIFSTFVKKETIITKEIVEAIKQASPDNADEVLLNKYKDKDIIDDIDAGDIVNNPDRIDEFILKGKNDSYIYDIAHKNYERRIWAFNIEADKNLSNTINILGYDAKVGDNINWTDNNTNKPPMVIATFKDENKEYKIILSAEGQKIFTDGNSQIFDYITIHQGILDKIYNVFGIKENDKEKHKVTNALHSFFSKPPKSNEAKTGSKDTETRPKETNTFLPNFIIHSGRSKPNEKDMPQHQPFVQFAAVDHAVKDCKYTLVELLATAHYEDNNNN